MAEGTRDAGRANPKVSVTFDQALFDAINQNAEDNGASFGAAVRNLCAIALDRVPPGRPSPTKTLRVRQALAAACHDVSDESVFSPDQTAALRSALSRIVIALESTKAE